jgi:pimeloyl-ACP methyl ester carboxylesterase
MAGGKLMRRDAGPRVRCDGATVEIPRADESLEACVVRIEALATRRETPCGDGVMVWRVWGEGPPLVLLHGGHGSWTHWIRNVQVLARHYTVYAADLPGFGDSDAPPDPQDGDTIARVVSDGLDALIPAPERYDLAGFSFGGIVGGMVAAQQGRRMRTLVVIGSSGLGLPSVGITGLRKWTPDMPADELTEVHRNNLGIIMIADPDRIDPLALHLQTLNTLKTRTKSSAIARSDALRRALPHITARIVCLSGARDVYVVANLEERKRLFRAVQPEAPFAFVEAAGHWAMYEAAEAFDTALLAQLEDRGG